MSRSAADPNKWLFAVTNLRVRLIGARAWSIHLHPGQVVVVCVLGRPRLSRVRGVGKV